MAATGGEGAGAPVPDFFLHFASTGGRAFADGIYEWTTVVNIRGGASTRAAMLLNRHNGDLIGKPVGLFADMVPAARARQLAAAVETVMNRDLPTSTGGDVRANMIKLEYQAGQRKFAANFNVMNRDYLAALEPVMAELQAIMGALLAKPERAVVASVERLAEAGQGVRFQWKLTNVGTTEVVVADPRLPGKRADGPRGMVKVAAVPAKTPGVMEIPPRWQVVMLETAPPATADSGVVIKAGGSWTATSVVWMPPKAGEYVVQGVWEDYPGATASQGDLQPAVPVDAGPDGRGLMLRGAAFSKYVKTTVAPR
jgi:hypothetical protein